MMKMTQRHQEYFFFILKIFRKQGVKNWTMTEYVKELYMNDNDFANVYHACENSDFGKFYRLDWYLFK
jgi:hypothetical protein